MDKKYLWYTLAVVFGLWLFAVTSVKAQEVKVPTVKGTIHVMYLDGTVNSFHSDVLFTSIEECYQAGMPAAINLSMQVPLIGYLIECVPNGEDA